VQMRASTAFGGRSRSQLSQLGLSSSAIAARYKTARTTG
jgi:hypothetical protein